MSTHPTFSAGKIRLAPIASALCCLFDFTEDVQFWIKDREGRYCRVNRGFLLNYSLERDDQVVGKTDDDLSPKHLADQFRLDDARVLAGHPIVNRIETVGRFDHTTCWCVTNKIALRDRSGRIVGTAGITCPFKNVDGLPNAPAFALGKAIAFIREHYARPIEIRSLAKSVNLSVRAFERQFRRTFQTSPRQYVKQLRIRMSCRALVYTDQPLAEIATAHGFCDQSHFTREFRRRLNMTPRQYRTRYRDPASDQPEPG